MALTPALAEPALAGSLGLPDARAFDCSSDNYYMAYYYYYYY